MDIYRSSDLIVGLAQEFISMVRRVDPSWTRAFWRFESEDSRFGSSSSYESSAGVTLISVFKEGTTLDRLNDLGRQLWESETDLNKRFCVCLLVVDSSFNYELKFEKSDTSRWVITKLNGSSGLPAGLEVA